MQNKLWKILVIAGTVLILSALFLCLYNVKESNRAYESSQEALAELVELIPEPTEKDESTEKTAAQENDIYAQYEEETEEEAVKEMPVIEIDGNIYCGYVSLPSLNIELPVLNEWSYPNLQISPCRYTGDIYNNDMIIAAHNYNSHFGQIKNLNSGDEIIFTDCEGNIHRYTVCYTEYVGGYDVEHMIQGSKKEWDITLFTCTLGGQSRVTVRGIAAEPEN